MERKFKYQNILSTTITTAQKMPLINYIVAMLHANKQLNIKDCKFKFTYIRKIRVRSLNVYIERSCWHILNSASQMAIAPKLTTGWGWPILRGQKIRHVFG
jgi:hypothetical protein